MKEIMSLNMEKKEMFYLEELEHSQSKEFKLFKWNESKCNENKMN